MHRILRPAERNLDLTRRLYLPRLPLPLDLSRLQHENSRLLTDKPFHTLVMLSNINIVQHVLR